MDTLRRSILVVKQCKKTMWKSIKMIGPLSCFRRRRSSTTKCTMENVLEDVTAITAENNMLPETLTAAKTIGEIERTSTLINSSKTEEIKKSEICDTEGQPRNIEIKDIQKKKRKQRNRKRRNNVKSQNAIKEQMIEGEGDEIKSFDPSPISSIEETASVETVSNVFPNVVNNETEFPEIQECDNGNIEDGKMIKIIKFQETASADISDISLKVEHVKNNKTDHSDIQKSCNTYNVTAEQRPQTLQEIITVAKVDDDIEQISAAMNSSKTEEIKHAEISNTEGQPQNVKVEEIKKKKNKRGNKKRRNNVKSENVISEQIIEGEGHEKKSFVPSPISSIKETTMTETETVNNVLPSVIGDGDLHSKPETALAKTMSDDSWRVKRINNNATERLHSRKSGNCYNGVADQHSQTQTVIKTTSTGEGITRKIVVHMFLSPNKNVVLDTTNNAWVPAIVARRAATDDDGVVAKINNESKSTEETNKSVRSILNKLTTENTDELIKRFMELPLNTIERLENAVDLVFERAIQEQSFAPLYAILCAAIQSVQVICAESMETKSFKTLIIKKCQRFFESDKAHQTESAKKLKKIRSCNDLEKKEELQFAYNENERKLRKRFVGNCCFIGELFNQHLVNPKVMQYCIEYLICQHSEEPIECLCNLLRSSGKELEKWCNLNDTFDNLKALTSVKNMSSKIRFMIQDIVELRRNKWLPRTGVGK